MEPMPLPTARRPHSEEFTTMILAKREAWIAECRCKREGAVMHVNGVPVGSRSVERRMSGGSEYSDSRVHDGVMCHD